jgi:hypothetical protein
MLTQETVLRVKQIAHRANKQAPWTWHGYPVLFKVKGLPTFYTENTMLEMQCEQLAMQYASIEEYQRNTRMIEAPTEEALALVDLNEIQGGQEP